MAKVYEASTAEDTVGGECVAKDCPLEKKDFAPGMYIVESGNKTYHLGCATRNKIKFKIPERRKIKRPKDD